MAESSRSSGLGGGSRPLWDPVAPADEEEEHPRQIAGGSEARSLWTMEVAEERGIPPPPPPVWRPSFPPPVAAYSAPAGRRRPSIRAPAPISPRSSPGYAPAFFCEIGRDEEGRHFLDNCTLCRKPLRNRDIYMYKGDVPFCSEECRQEQIDKDEARERTGSMKTSPRKSSSSSSPEQQQKGIRVPAAGAIVAG